MARRILPLIAGFLLLVLAGLFYLIFFGSDGTGSPDTAQSSAVNESAAVTTEQTSATSEPAVVENTSSNADALPRPDGSFILKDTDLATGICTDPSPVRGETAKALFEWAVQREIDFKDAFVRTVLHINENGRLPNCYLTKNQAEQRGWSRDNLWDHVAGTAIGGDSFGNRERLLPRRHNGSYIEADIDFTGGRRGAHRLVFVEGRRGDALIWLTLDHYESFELIDLGAL